MNAGSAAAAGAGGGAISQAAPSGSASSAAGQVRRPWPGDEALRTKGWWPAHRFLVQRRLSQLGIAALFLLGPLAGVWLVKGNPSSSLGLGMLPLTDPFVLAQVLAARHVPETAALLGAAIVIAFYALVGGRVFCAWVCPVKVVTDGAALLRRRLKISTGRAPRMRWSATRGCCGCQRATRAAAATVPTVSPFAPNLRSSPCR